jgi:hypothetical protein
VDAVWRDLIRFEAMIGGDGGMVIGTKKLGKSFIRCWGELAAEHYIGQNRRGLTCTCEAYPLAHLRHEVVALFLYHLSVSVMVIG